MKLSHLIIAALTLAIAHPAASLYFQQMLPTPQERCVEEVLGPITGSPNQVQIATAYKLCS